MASRTRSRGSARASARGGIEIFTRPRQTLVVRILGLLVRLRAELTITVVVITGHVLLTNAGMTPGWAWVTEATVIILIVAVPVSRRYVVGRFWAVLSRHRLRACLNQTRAMSPMTYNGKLPLLLWSRPSPIGERIRVWLPAGLSVKDIEAVSDKLAAACWAREARIEPSRRQAALVVVEIVRRDPFESRRVLRPRVIESLPEPVTTNGTVIPLPRREDITPTAAPAHPASDKHEPSTPTPMRNGRQRRATPHTTADDEPSPAPVVGIGGMDLTDYV